MRGGTRDKRVERLTERGVDDGGLDRDRRVLGPTSRRRMSGAVL